MEKDFDLSRQKFLRILIPRWILEGFLRTVISEGMQKIGIQTNFRPDKSSFVDFFFLKKLYNWGKSRLGLV